MFFLYWKFSHTQNLLGMLDRRILYILVLTFSNIATLIFLSVWVCLKIHPNLMRKQLLRLKRKFGHWTEEELWFQGEAVLFRGILCPCWFWFIEFVQYSFVDPLIQSLRDQLPLHMCMHVHAPLIDLHWSNWKYCVKVIGLNIKYGLKSEILNLEKFIYQCFIYWISVTVVFILMHTGSDICWMFSCSCKIYNGAYSLSLAKKNWILEEDC